MTTKKTKEKVELSPQEKLDSLNVIVPRYFQNNTSANALKKLTEADSKIIKSVMSDLNLESYTANGVTAEITIIDKPAFVEEQLMALLKSKKLKDCIKKKEYVDMDMLESYIYDGQISAAELEKVQEVSHQVRLNISLAKPENLVL